MEDGRRMKKERLVHLYTQLHLMDWNLFACQYLPLAACCLSWFAMFTCDRGCISPKPCQWLHILLDSRGRDILCLHIVLILRLLPSTSFIVYIAVFTHLTISSSYTSHCLPNIHLILSQPPLREELLYYMAY